MTKVPRYLIEERIVFSTNHTETSDYLGLPGGSVVKNLPAFRRCGFDPWVRKIPWRRKWQPTPVILPEKSDGQRNLAGYSPWDCKRVRHELVTKQQ